MRTRWMGLIAMGVALAAAGARAQQCDDFDTCTSNDMCVDGRCMGTMSNGCCDDFNDCTVNDRYDPESDSCIGDPVADDTPCQGGCGTCQALAPPIPGIYIPPLCVGDAADNGKTCEAPDFGPCFESECNIIAPPVPGLPAVAFCNAGTPMECPDAGNCKGVCNPETGRCDNTLSRCFGDCERCDQGQCVPANQGKACSDFDPCTPQSKCGTFPVGGEPRGFCVAGEPSGDTPTPTATGVVSTPTAPPTATRTTGNTPTPGPCVGDCSNDGVVAINELITGVNIALGNAQASTCPSFDTNSDGSVAVNELISGVNALLNGCAA